MQYAFTAPVAPQFSVDPPVTGIQINGVALNLDTGQLSVSFSPIGGPPVGPQGRVCIVPLSGAQVTALENLIKPAVAAALGATFQ
jgi:hypothetical protein